MSTPIARIGVVADFSMNDGAPLYFSHLAGFMQDAPIDHGCKDNIDVD